MEWGGASYHLGWSQRGRDAGDVRRLFRVDQGWLGKRGASYGSGPLMESDRSGQRPSCIRSHLIVSSSRFQMATFSTFVGGGHEGRALFMAHFPTSARARAICIPISSEIDRPCLSIFTPISSAILKRSAVRSASGHPRLVAVCDFSGGGSNSLVAPGHSWDHG